MKKFTNPSLSDHRNSFLFVAIILAVLGAYSLNATLIYDDLWIITLFRGYRGWKPDFASLCELFSTADLNGEYRLYGLSKLIHLGLSYVCGTHAWAWGGIMGASQLATSVMINRFLRNLRVDRIQSAAVALVWIISPFAFTSCFHHFSYLILPCQLTVIGALLLQKLLKNETEMNSGILRLVLIPIGLAIAWTGESHLLLTGFILAVAGFISPSSRSFWSRTIESMIPLMAICVGILLHRALWSGLIRHHPLAVSRFHFSVPNREEVSQRGLHFLNSLPEGVFCQVKPILILTGWPTFILVVSGVIALGFLLRRVLAKIDSSVAEFSCGEPRAFVVSFTIFLALIASISVTAGVGILSNQVMDVLPRRYGYIPFTIGLMLIVSLATEPRVRRDNGFAPMIVVLSLIVTLWGGLQVFCLPLIRSQDRQLWDTIRLAASKKTNPNILFVNAWDNPEEPGFSVGAATPAMRDGIRFPEIFESTFTSYWWVEPYAKLRLKIPNVGFRADISSPKRVRLHLGRVFFPPELEDTVEVPTSSLVVVADSGIMPPRWDQGLVRVKVFSDWTKYQNSLAAFGGSIKRGWKAQFPEGEDELATIDLGLSPGQPAPEEILSDKRFSELWEARNHITNYGWKDGTDNLYKMPASGDQLSYYSTNRNGAFVYGIEFDDASRKIVYLDFMELWLSKPGVRKMILDVNYGGEWIRVGVLDPFAIAGRDPFSVRLTVATKSVQIRIRPAPGASDVPFVNGIRILKSRR